MSGSVHIRVATLNLWGDTPPLDVRMAIAVELLAELDPDVIALQEVALSSAAPLRTTADTLAERLGMACVTEHGLALLSRYRIAEWASEVLPSARGEAEQRALLSARVEVDTLGGAWLHTTHLDWRLDDGVHRERQVVAIDRKVRSLSSELPQLVCGDFNAESDSDEIRFLRGLTTLDGTRCYYQDAWSVANPGMRGDTWSMANPHNHDGRTIAFDRRIDYIFVTARAKDGRGTVLSADLACTDVVDGICASDHYGVVADIEFGAKTAK